MAKTDVTVELFYSGGWQDHTGDVYTRADIQIVRGRGSESTTAPPAQATLTFDNRSGTFNPTNPSSPLYGLVGRNTPIRISIGIHTRFYGEVSSWAPRRAIKGDAWTDVEAAGITRRLGHGDEPLHSPIRREALDADDDAVRVAYWPMEDESGATRLASAVPGAQSAQMRGEVTPASYEGFGGSLPLPVLGSGGNIFGNVPRHTPGAEYARVLISVPSGGMTDQSSILGLRCRDGGVARFEVTYGATFGDLELRALADDGTEIATAGPWGFDVDGTQFLLSLELVQDGADIDWLLFVRKVDDSGELDAGGLETGTFTGLTLGEVMRMGVGDGGGMDGAAVGHMMIGTSQSLVFNISDALTGWRGETTANRFIRLCDELDLPRATVTTLEGEDDTPPMGPQRPGTFADLLAEIERTDGGFIFESREDEWLTIRTGRSLNNQDPVLLALTMGIDVAPPLDPVLDDRDTFNDVTATRPGGSSARAVLETGPLSVQAPPAGVGRNPTTVEVNTQSDDHLSNYAQWHLVKGTVAGARYPQVTVDLTAADATLRSNTSLVDIGDLITIDGLEADQVRLIVVGYTETIGSHHRRVTFNCVPADPYRVAEVEHDDYAIVGSDRTTLEQDFVAGTDTTMELTVAGVGISHDEWSDAEAPFDILVGGVRLTVTAFSNVASDREFTVNQTPVNGITKTIPAGTQVDVFHASYIGL